MEHIPSLTGRPQLCRILYKHSSRLWRDDSGVIAIHIICICELFPRYFQLSVYGLLYHRLSSCVQTHLQSRAGTPNFKGKTHQSLSISLFFLKLKKIEELRGAKCFNRDNYI